MGKTIEQGKTKSLEIKLIDSVSTEEMNEIARLTGGVAKYAPQLRRIYSDGIHSLDYPLKIVYPTLGMELDFYSDPSDQWLGPEKPALAFANGDYISLANAAVVFAGDKFLFVKVSSINRESSLTELTIVNLSDHGTSVSRFFVSDDTIEGMEEFMRAAVKLSKDNCLADS